MSEPDSPRTPAAESLDSQESYMARSLSTTQVTKTRRADRSKKHGKAKPGSRLGRLDETMMKRTHSVSPYRVPAIRICSQLCLADRVNYGISRNLTSAVLLTGPARYRDCIISSILGHGS